MRFLQVALAVLGLVSPALGQTYVATYSNQFHDPYNDGGALLDLDVNTGCPGGVQVAVHFPKTWQEAVDMKQSTSINAYFDGASFAARPVTGLSQHSGSNNGQTFTTTVNVAWDNDAKIMTFSGFDTSSSWGAFVPVTNPNIQLPPGNWYNFNFDVIAADFAPGGPVPLNTVAFPDLPDSVKYLDFPTNTIPAPLSVILGLTYGVFDPATTPQTDPFEAQVIQNSGTHCGGNPPGGSGDPVFSGFQGQQFQFHGLPDEHFNLVSSPDVQLNSHFVYLSSGKCDYNDTECFTHPGTYMDVLGLSVGDSHIKMVAGTHEAGMRVWVNDVELQRGQHIKQLSQNVTGALRYHHNGKVDISTELLGLEVVNSDMFMNVRAALNDQQLLRTGAHKHTVTDKTICHTNSETHNHQLVEQTVAKKYPVTTQLHGLIGQTWRNVLVCGRNWMGTVQDYIVSDLFASDNHYNYFKW